MGTTTDYQRQPERLLIAIGYLLLLGGANWVLAGVPFPALDADGVWFYSGAAFLLLGTSLQEPFYPTPSTAAANSLALLIAAAAFPAAAGEPVVDSAVVGIAKLVVAIVAAVTLVASFSVILTKDALGRYSSWLVKPVSEVGSAKVIYSIIFVGSVLVTRADAIGELTALLMTWAVIALLRPLERVNAWVRYAKRNRVSRAASGSVRRLIAPSLVDAVFASTRPARGTVLETAAGAAVVLDAVPQGEGAWVLAAAEGSLPTVGSEVRIVSVGGDDAERPVGPIDVRSNGLEVVLRVPSTEDRLRLGRLVTCPVLGEDCIFQIVDVEVTSTAVGDDATYQHLAVTARKVGRWNRAERRFEVADWLPAPGTLARVVSVSAPDGTEGLGYLPYTDIAIDLDPNLLVTHNSAVLGILGVGKSVLARQLTSRVLGAGVKVVVLDITGEWSDALSSWVNPQQEDKVAESINAQLRGIHEKAAKNRSIGGSARQFESRIEAVLRRFWESDQPLLVLNPEAFIASRQISFEKNGESEFARLSPADITSIVSGELLSLVQSMPLTDQARLLLVVEEAHALVPEWNSAVSKSDQDAVNATARAVLQGRKYGLGVMIISQRTANVTKTILNQCHTVVAMRSYDATGIEFLSNYVGPSYSGLLPTLPERQMVVFGRASSCPTPVVLQVHDQTQFWEDVGADLSEGASIAAPDALVDEPSDT